MILVTGATGTVGREVVAQLAATGQKVRALTRDASRTKFPAGVEVAVGDLEKPETLAKALEGVERVFSLAIGPTLAEREKNLAVAAKQAGARHIVKLSVLGAGGQSRSAITEWHDAGEKAIQDSGLAWTFVRPSGFMSNALQWVATVKNQGKVFSNRGDGKFPSIHPRDIAAVAVKALTSPGHEGKAYAVTGPEALSMGEHVKILSEAAGRPIEYVALSDDAMREGMAKAGLPAPLADALIQSGVYVRSGKAAEVLPTLEQVTGRKALTFSEWARENAAAFK